MSTPYGIRTHEMKPLKYHTYLYYLQRLSPRSSLSLMCQLVGLEDLVGQWLGTPEAWYSMLKAPFRNKEYREIE